MNRSASKDETNQSMDLRRLEVDRVSRDVLTWARARRDVLGLAMVGSWARGKGRLDSDIDLILLTGDADSYLKSGHWIAELGLGPIVREEVWGPNITERRFALPSGLEVELSIAHPAWVATDPVDKGTERVIGDGIQILYDPQGLFGRLVKEVRSGRE